MFNSARYMTKGVQTEIPLELQLFMWSCIDSLPQERDCLQVFKMNVEDGVHKLHHYSEQPEYSKEYTLKVENPIAAKIAVQIRRQFFSSDCIEIPQAY